VAVTLPRLVDSFKLRGIEMQTGLQRRERIRRSGRYIFSKKEEQEPYASERCSPLRLHVAMFFS
jgi:hypothetical protein